MKKIMSMIMAIVLVISMSLSASAAPATDNCVMTDVPTSTVPDRTMSGEQITVSLTPAQSTLKAGDVFTVELNISENHYITNCDIIFSYNPTVLELVEINPDNPELAYVKSINTQMLRSAMSIFRLNEPGNFHFVAASMASKGTTTGGVLFPMTFRVLDGWYGQAAIEVTVKEMVSVKTSYGEYYNTNIVVENAFVDVIEQDFLRGDVNRDGVIDIGDAVLTFRSVNGRESINYIQHRRAEVTDDGVVDVADATTLFRYINGRITEL